MGAVAGINESTSTQELINISEWGSSKIKDYRTSYIEILNLKQGLLHEVLERDHLHRQLDGLCIASHIPLR